MAGFMAALPAITAGAGILGKLLSSGAKGAADQRVSENSQRLQQQQLAEQGLMNRANFAEQGAMNRANMQMQQALFRQQEPNAQARQAAIGSLLQRIQPVRVQGNERVRIPQMNSILDALGPEARQAGALLAQRGVSGLQNPTALMEMPALQALPAFQQQALKQSGLLEKILGGAGLVGSMIGALGDVNDLARKTRIQGGRDAGLQGDDTAWLVGPADHLAGGG